MNSQFKYQDLELAYSYSCLRMRAGFLYES